MRFFIHHLWEYGKEIGEDYNGDPEYEQITTIVWVLCGDCNKTMDELYKEYTMFIDDSNLDQKEGKRQWEIYRQLEEDEKELKNKQSQITGYICHKNQKYTHEYIWKNIIPKNKEYQELEKQIQELRVKFRECIDAKNKAYDKAKKFEKELEDSFRIDEDGPFKGSSKLMD